MVYVVITDAGGASVPFTYRYYLHDRMDDEQVLLQELARDSAFLVTRDGNAHVVVEGRRVKVMVRNSVYSFNSIAMSKEGEPVDIWLDARTDD